MTVDELISEEKDFLANYRRLPASSQKLCRDYVRDLMRAADDVLPKDRNPPGMLIRDPRFPH